MVLSIIFLEDKHKILLHLLILYEYQQFFQHRICFSIQPQLQLVNLHRNRRYFVIKLHTWFCLSYFLKTNITFYSIYQYFMSISSFFNTVSVSRYSRPITVTVTQINRSQQFFLNRYDIFNYVPQTKFGRHITFPPLFIIIIIIIYNSLFA
jgi:hypothetical protein